MARRRSDHQTFMAAHLRAHMRPGMTAAERREVFREATHAWNATKRGHNPYEDAVSCPDCGERLHGLHPGMEIVCPGCGTELEIEE